MNIPDSRHMDTSRRTIWSAKLDPDVLNACGNQDGGEYLVYNVDANVDGNLTQLGSNIVDESVKKAATLRLQVGLAPDTAEDQDATEPRAEKVWIGRTLQV